MKHPRPSVFIGSSAEGLPFAEAIQLNLDRDCDVVIWYQGVFGLSDGNLECLIEKADEFDFAILVLTPDDLTFSRGKRKPSPRDNVLLELGMFIGVLGRKRTFVVYDRTANMKLPSDLAGVALADYQPHQSGNVQASVGAACTMVKTSIKRLGLRERSEAARETNRKHQKERLQVLKEISNYEAALYENGNATLEKLLEAKSDVAKAELELCESDQERVEARKTLVALRQQLVDICEAHHRAGARSKRDVLQAKTDLLKAQSNS
jgi:hypothetical protein